MVVVRKLVAATALAAGVAVGWAAPAAAATQTVTLSVPDMSCAACPITVKQALSKVDGVSAVTVSLQDRKAVVTFEDTKTNAQELTEATKAAGYPSSIAD